MEKWNIYEEKHWKCKVCHPFKILIGHLDALKNQARWTSNLPKNIKRNQFQCQNHEATNFRSLRYFLKVVVRVWKSNPITSGSENTQIVSDLFKVTKPARDRTGTCLPYLVLLTQISHALYCSIKILSMNSQNTKILTVGLG